MKKNIQICIKSSFFTLAMSLIVTLWISSFFEIISRMFSGISISHILISFGYTILADIESVLLIGIVLYPVYFLFGYLKKPLVQMSVHILFSLLVITQFALAKYEYTNIVNIGMDFLGLSSDIFFSTVTKAEPFSIIFLVPFIFFPIYYVIIEKYILSLKISKS